MNEQEIYSTENLRKYGKEYFDFITKVKKFNLTYYGNWQREFAKFLTEIADFKNKPKNILDVGCGCGHTLRAMEELNIFEEMIGIDISRYILTEIVPKLHEFKTPIKFYNIPSWNLSMIKNKSIDFIICSHIFEHIPDVERVKRTLNELKRVLHPNGKIISIIPPPSKKENKDSEIFHTMNKPPIWWSNIFSKYFKSETSIVRKKFKETKFKPDINKDETFYDVYKNGWNIFRLVHK